MSGASASPSAIRRGTIASPAGVIVRRPGKRPPVAEIVRRAEALEAQGFRPRPAAGRQRRRNAAIHRSPGDRRGLDPADGASRPADRRALHHRGRASGHSRDGRVDARPKGRRRRARRDRTSSTCARPCGLNAHAPSRACVHHRDRRRGRLQRLGRRAGPRDDSAGREHARRRRLARPRPA